jgi:hypothetical protein
LRDTGGIYLVSVYRAATGNIHRAVGQEFVLNVGDILYFTGLVESFGEFCEEHGLEILTNELDEKTDETPHVGDDVKESDAIPEPASNKESNMGTKTDLLPVFEGEDHHGEDQVPAEIGVTVESLLNADEAERSRAITRMIGQ